MINNRFITSLIFLAMTMLLIAQQDLGREDQKVGNSDLILTGTVSKIQDADASYISDDVGMKVAPMDPKFASLRRITKVLTISVDETLKGSVTTRDITVAVSVFANQNIDWLPKAGDTAIFFLQRNRSSFSLTYGQLGIQPLAKIDAIEKTIKSVPISIELSLFQSPLFFGKTAQLSVKVTNLTDSPIILRNFSLQGFYYAKRMENFVNVAVQLADAQIDPEKPAIPPIPISIAGKQTMEIKLNVTAQVPQSMALLGADSYMMTIAALYANVNYASEADKTRFTIARSNWNDAFLGFP